MTTRQLWLPASVLAVAGALTVGMPVTAGAAAAPASMPPGYQVAFGPIVTVADGTQGRSTVHCPKGTVPLGGGLFLNAVSLTAGVSSSFPTSNGWTGVVNNLSGSSGSMVVAVTCAHKPAQYSVVISKPVANPDEHRTTVTVSCPKSAKPLGGGAQGASGAFVGLAASQPFHDGWRIIEENATANFTADATSPQTVRAYVVCGSVAGYRVVTTKPQTVTALSQATLLASCPSGGVVLGGGAAVRASVLGVNFNMTGPIDPTVESLRTAAPTKPPFAWQTIVNNNNEVDASAAPFAICAGR